MTPLSHLFHRFMEYQVGKDLQDHLVQPFRVRTQFKRDGSALFSMVPPHTSTVVVFFYRNVINCPHAEKKCSHETSDERWNHSTSQSS